MSDYERFPPNGPSRRAIWILVLVVLALLIANILDQVTG
jgi:hypothetical protein